MGISFLSWSMPLSLGLIIVLGGLLPHLSTSGVLRIGTVALSLPAFVCSIIIFKITVIDSSIIMFPILYSLVPIDFGVYFTAINAFLIACSMLSFTVIVFGLPTTNLGNNLVFLAITYAALIIPHYFKNL